MRETAPSVASPVVARSEADRTVVDRRPDQKVADQKVAARKAAGPEAALREAVGATVEDRTVSSRCEAPRCAHPTSPRNADRCTVSGRGQDVAMGYALGVDLGTTYTACAVHREGRVEIVALGSRTTTIPSVVFVDDDDTVLTGERAHRRAVTSPGRVVREFKRRLGDTTPILLAGAPYSAEQLTARLLRSVVDAVAELEGGMPDALMICHPANWGPYKIELLEQAVRLADLEHAAFVTEPEAAAISYASAEHVAPGEVVAVYDLGGGTFDAAVLRKTESGFEILGKPEGIEHLGGIDFDEAVFAHVRRALDGALDGLDPRTPRAMAAVARLRQDCVEAKEALSSETDVTVNVLLPDLQTEVRLTRAEFEA